MTNEELTQKMEFIVEQQAQFSADIEAMREVHAADTKLLKEESKLGKQQIHSLNAAVTAVLEWWAGYLKGKKRQITN